MKPVFDVTKPLQLSDGSPVSHLGPSTAHPDGCVQVAVEGVFGVKVFRPNGEHVYNRLPDLMNVPSFSVGDKVNAVERFRPFWRDLTVIEVTPEGEIRAQTPDGQVGLFFESELEKIEEPTLDWTKPLQTREGRDVRCEGPLPDGRRCVTGRGPKRAPGTTYIVHPDGRVSDLDGHVSGDDVVNKELPITKAFLNVYADGSTGSPHKTFDDAMSRSKYGKVRVGILEQHRRDGGIITARVVPTSPQLRTRDNPDGINPFK